MFKTTKVMINMNKYAKYTKKKILFMGQRLYVWLFCCSQLLSKIFEGGHPPKRSGTSPYRRTVRPGSWATRPATMPSITSYPVPRNRFRLSRSSKRFISIRRLIADRTGIVETTARNRETGKSFRHWRYNLRLIK